MPRKKVTRRVMKKVKEERREVDERRIVAFWIIIALAAIFVLAM